MHYGSSECGQIILLIARKPETFCVGTRRKDGVTASLNNNLNPYSKQLKGVECTSKEKVTHLKSDTLMEVLSK